MYLLANIRILPSILHARTILRRQRLRRVDDLADQPLSSQPPILQVSVVVTDSARIGIAYRVCNTTRLLGGQMFQLILSGGRGSTCWLRSTSNSLASLVVYEHRFLLSAQRQGV